MPDDVHVVAAACEEDATRKEAAKGKEAAMSMSLSTKDADRASAAGAIVDRVALNDHLGW